MVDIENDGDFADVILLYLVPHAVTSQWTQRGTYLVPHDVTSQ
jgi:hypothetical protein